MNQKIEDQNRRMDCIIEWVKVCDSKTAILMSVVLLVPTFIIGTDWVLSRLGNIISLIIDAINCNGVGYCFSITNFLSLVLLSLTIVCTIFSFCLFISVLKAKTKENTYCDKGIKWDSLIHFNNISKIKTFKKYKEAVQMESDETYYEDLLSQTYINAKRCAEKFALYNRGLRWLCFAMTSMCLFVVVLFFIQV